MACLETFAPIAAAIAFLLAMAWVRSRSFNRRYPRLTRAAMCDRKLEDAE